MWLGAIARAPPMRDIRTFRARTGSPSRETRREPWAVRQVRPFGDRTPPSPTRMCQMRQGWVRPAFAVTPHIHGGPAGPATTCGSNAAGSKLGSRFCCAALEPVPAFSPEALALIHRDRAGPRTSAGVSLRKLLALGYGPRAPELTASRRPELRVLRPSVGTEGEDIVACGERVGKKGTKFLGASLSKTPPQPLPTRGRGLTRIGRFFSIAESQPVEMPALSAGERRQSEPLTLVGRGLFQG